MSNWERAANYIESEYGAYVDWEERFWNCPECGEPVYECDWDNSELLNTHDSFICPICEQILE